MDEVCQECKVEGLEFRVHVREHAKEGSTSVFNHGNVDSLDNL